MKRFVFVLIYTMSLYAVGASIVNQMNNNKPADKQEINVKQESVGDLDLLDDSMCKLKCRAKEEVMVSLLSVAE